MKKFKNFTKRLASNNRGQGMVEYILLLVVVVAIVLAMKGKLSDYVNNNLWPKLSGAMDQVTNSN